MCWRTALTQFAIWPLGLCTVGFAHPATPVFLVLAAVLFAGYVRVGNGNRI